MLSTISIHFSPFSVALNANALGKPRDFRRFLNDITLSSRPALHNVSMYSLKVLYCMLASLRILVILASAAVTFMMSANICSLSRRSTHSAYSFLFMANFSSFSTVPAVS